ncbi:MAG: hypothetical protein K6F46_07710 [Desulfovibrio sp.]|nr:hypothetical protein [Desulfovibrio sp.]
MKRFAAAFAAFLALTFLAMADAQARDSGDERTIPVTQWKCESCGMEFFTFTPDDVGFQSGPAQNKDVRYQQSNWFLLKDRSRPVPKCPRLDGGHALRKTGARTISGKNLAEAIDKFIVLKNGREIQSVLNRVRCGICGMEAYCFDGDDLDCHDAVTLSARLHLWYLQNRSAVNDCRGKLPYGGKDMKAHVFLLVSKQRPSSSMRLAETLRYVIYSD